VTKLVEVADRWFPSNLNEAEEALMTPLGSSSNAEPGELGAAIDETTGAAANVSSMAVHVLFLMPVRNEGIHFP